MAPATPSLLGLPRELRDEIYSYLHHETCLDPNWPRCLLLGDIQMEKIKSIYSIFKVPIVNLLLVNAQIKTEYTESDCLKDLSVTTYINVDPTSYQSTWMPFDNTKEEEECRARSGDALGHVRRLNVHFLCGAGPAMRGRYIGSCVDKLMDRTRTDAPHIRTVRINCCLASIHRLRDPNEAYRPFTSSTFLPLPLPSLDRLPLVQRAEGYRVGKYVRFSTGFRHDVVRFGAYVYHRGPTKVSFWDVGEVVDSFPFAKFTKCDPWYGDPGLPSFGCFDEKNVQWREKWGLEEAEAWF
jgi:hypothetical protein